MKSAFSLVVPVIISSVAVSLIVYIFQAAGDPRRLDALPQVYGEAICQHDEDFEHFYYPPQITAENIDIVWAGYLDSFKEGCHPVQLFGVDVASWHSYENPQYQDIVAYKMYRVQFWEQELGAPDRLLVNSLDVVLLRLRDGSQKIWPSFYFPFTP